MPGIRIELTGGEALAAQLDGLGKAVSGKIMRAALSAAARPIEASARSLVHVRSGLLRRSIHAAGKRDGPFRAAMILSASATRGQWNKLASGRKAKGAASGRMAVYYDIFLEYGHKLGRGPSRKEQRQRERRGESADTRAAVEAHPFMRQGFDSNVASASAIIEEQLRAGIDAAL